MDLTERQQEILSAAIELIALAGIQSLTIKNLALKLNITEPAIYRHFKNKQALVVAMIDSFQEVAKDALAENTQTKFSAKKIIEKFLLDRYQRFAKNPKLAKVMFSESAFQNDEILKSKMLELMHQHKEKLEALILAAQKQNEIRSDIAAKEIFRIIFGAMRLLVNQWCLSEFAFDLKKEGLKLWEATEKLLKN